MRRAIATGALVFAVLAEAGAQTVEFNRDIRPILSDKCYTCHGPDAANRTTPLRFDTERGMRVLLAKGRRAVVPGHPEASELIRRVTAANPATRMPPAYAGAQKLTASEIALLRRWIARGAKWQRHWSFLPPRRPPLPVLRDRSWPRNGIDHYVLRRLEREKLRPSPEADPATLLRRVSLDLTGLPPALEDVDAFLRNPSNFSNFSNFSNDAYEQAVDRLLATPEYAERMAIRWLEAARYADTHGYQADGRRTMWPWRDWVIEAFQRNMPFDQFTIEQIAGDLLPAPSLSQRIATGFNRNHRTNGEGGIVPEEYRVEYVADRVETTATVWMGLTLGCARCHDHKYDPFTQKEFYRLFAFFNNVPEKGLVYNFDNDEPMIKAPTPEQQSRLDDLDGRLKRAEAAWNELQPEVARQQAIWEALRPAAPLDWQVTEGQVLHADMERAGNPVEGRVGQAERFDGGRFFDPGADSAKVAHFDYMDAFTLSAWIRPESADGAIVSRMEDYFEGEGYGLLLKDGKVRLHIHRRFTDIGMRLETEQPVALGRWQHVAVTYDGYRYASGVRIYIDGKPWKLNVLFDDLNFPFGPKEPVRIGGGFGPELRFRGAIDEVRLYKRALAPEEASVLPLTESVSQIAALPPAQRTEAQRSKLRLCFLEKHAPQNLLHALAALRSAREERLKFYDSLPTVMVMAESPTPRETFLLKRGAYDNPGEKVTAGTPAALPAFSAEWPPNRLGLARWLVDRSHPLTARVAVNRFWQNLFGTGLVKTLEDFGAQGEWPLHADLLDWLAVEFMESGWDVKRLMKTMVMSATYRQSSKTPPELQQRDPENRLLARGPRFRLPAEMLRDQALAVSGLLVRKVGGPPVKPYQPPGLWQELAGGRGYEPDKGEALYRRSLYTYWKRTVAPPSMVTFDSPTREFCVVRETRTNTPLQALNLMNDVVYLEASRRLAERMMTMPKMTKAGGARPADRIAYGFRLVLARAPNPGEARLLEDAWRGFLDSWAADKAAAAKFLAHGESPADATLNAAELAAYTAIASLLLNLDEAVTLE